MTSTLMPKPTPSAIAPPLRPEDRWPLKTIALLRRDLTDANRSGDPHRVAAAEQALAAELDYLAVLGTTFLDHALSRRPHAATAEFLAPLDGVRDDVLGLAGRVAELERAVAGIQAAVGRLTATRSPAGEVG